MNFHLPAPQHIAKLVVQSVEGLKFVNCVDWLSELIVNMDSLWGEFTLRTYRPIAC